MQKNLSGCKSPDPNSARRIGRFTEVSEKRSGLDSDPALFRSGFNPAQASGQAHPRRPVHTHTAAEVQLCLLQMELAEQS